MTTSAESIVSDAAQGGTLVAYQVGCRYPRFTGVNREALAAVFERHGFEPIATKLREYSDRDALAHAVTRPGQIGRKGLHIVPVKRKAGDHDQAWVICRASEVGAEDVAHAPGARVFSSPAGLFAAPPIDGAEDPDCRALANALVARAQSLMHTCDGGTVSAACSSALETVAAYPFLSKGSYILRAGDPSAERLVSLYRDLRDSFYDETRRAGIQAGVAEITAQPANMMAVSDSVINDAEAKVAALAAQLEADTRNSKLRAGTLERHRDAAQSVLDALRPVRELLGASFERIEKITSGVLTAYKGATTSADLSFPEWIASDAADLREDADGAVPVSSPEAAAEPPSNPAPAAEDDAFSL